MPPTPVTDGVVGAGPGAGGAGRAARHRRGEAVAPDARDPAHLAPGVAADVRSNRPGRPVRAATTVPRMPAGRAGARDLDRIPTGADVAVLRLTRAKLPDRGGPAAHRPPAGPADPTADKRRRRDQDAPVGRVEKLAQGVAVGGGPVAPFPARNDGRAKSARRPASAAPIAAPMMPAAGPPPGPDAGGASPGVVPRRCHRRGRRTRGVR